MTRFLELRQDATAFVLLGTIALSVVQVCQLEVAYAVLFDVWSKSIKHQFLAPIGLRHLTLGSWIPLTHFLDAYRAHYGFASEFAHPIAIGFALAAAYALLAHLALAAALRHARSSGLLLKMSE